MKKSQVLNAVIEFYDNKKDIVCLRYLPEVKASDDVESAQQIIESMQPFFVKGQPQGCLVEAPTFYVDKKVLDVYQHADYGEVARAIVTASFATKVMGNMFMKLTKNKPNKNGRVVPTKLFTTREKAVAWLREQIESKMLEF